MNQPIETTEPYEGLVDGGHLYAVCNNCRARLLDIFCVRPDEPVTMKIRAKNCPFCDENPKTAPLGGSYYIEAKGRVALGGYGEVRDGCDEDDEGSTIMDEQIQVNELTWDITVKKYNEKAKPVYER